MRLKLTLQFESRKLKSSICSVIKISQVKKIIKLTQQKPAILTIRFVNQIEGVRINRFFRQSNHATNILTFCYYNERNVQADLVICWPIVLLEAKKQKKNIHYHLLHLLVHGVLHAHGFDHQQENESIVMENLEIGILKKLDIPNPY